MAEAEIERMDQLLIKHLDAIHELYKVLDQPTPTSPTKVSWDDVIKSTEELYHQATAVGMLWTEEGVDANALEARMRHYFNLLHGFLSLSHGSMNDAETTHVIDIHAYVNEVIDRSFTLLKESVSSYGNSNKAHQLSDYQIFGTVWQASSFSKDTPATTIIAIAGFKHLADDALRNMKKLMPRSSNNDTNDNDSSFEGVYGCDLSLDEMKITELAIGVMNGILSIVNETIRLITSLFKNLQTRDNNNQMVEYLKNLSRIWEDLQMSLLYIRNGVDPPQAINSIRTGYKKMVRLVGEL